MWLVEKLDGGIVAGFSEFSDSSGKTSHTVSHSSSISEMSFCRLTWKEEVIKMVEALTDQCVARSVEEVKD